MPNACVHICVCAHTAFVYTCASARSCLWAYRRQKKRRKRPKAVIFLELDCSNLNELVCSSDLISSVEKAALMSCSLKDIAVFRKTPHLNSHSIHCLKITVQHSKWAEKVDLWSLLCWWNAQLFLPRWRIWSSPVGRSVCPSKFPTACATHCKWHWRTLFRGYATKTVHVMKH